MKVYLALFVAYILAPKINIIEVGDAGVRPEDFITLIATLIYALQRDRAHIPIPKYIKSYLAVIFCGFFSAIYNYRINGITGFVFVVRLIEYLVWFPIGCEMARRMPPGWFRNALLVSMFGLIIWGLGEYFGLIEKIGRFTTVGDRLTINTSGPFETSVVLAALAFAARQWVATPIMIALIWLTQARVTLVASAISFLARKPGQGLLISALSALLVFAASGPLATVLDGSRFAEAQGPMEMAKTLRRTARVAPTLTPLAFKIRFLTGGEMASYVKLGGQGSSFNIRAIRWSTVIKSTLSSTSHMMIGWGPGAWGLALDGYYVRVFAETGFIGLALFIYWITTMVRGLDQESSARFMMIMLCIVAVFIDIFTASKAMPILWVLAALDYVGNPHRHPSGSPLRVTSRMIKKQTG